MHEHPLGTLRHSEPVPWAALLVIVGVAALLQMIFVILVGEDIRYVLEHVSVQALVGEPVPPKWTDPLWDFWQSARRPILWSQLGANLCALFLIGRERGLARRVFFGLGVLGLLAWLSQLPLGWKPAWGTLASAVGSVLAAWVLRSTERPSGRPE